MISNKCLLLELGSGGAHGQMNTWAINFEILKFKFFETFDKAACKVFEILNFIINYLNYRQNGKGTTIYTFRGC